LRKKRIKAAIKIQTAFRARRAKNIYRTMILLREKAAEAIQRTWKRHRNITMIPKVMKERRKRALVIIQKFMRGYMEFNKHKSNVRQFRLKNNFIFFDKIRLKLLAASQMIIRYYWLKKKNRLDMKKKGKSRAIKLHKNNEKSDKKSKKNKRAKRYKHKETLNQKQTDVKSPKSPKKGKNKKVKANKPNNEDIKEAIEMKHASVDKIFNQFQLKPDKNNLRAAQSNEEDQIQHTVSSSAPHITSVIDQSLKFRKRLNSFIANDKNLFFESIKREPKRQSVSSNFLKGNNDDSIKVQQQLQQIDALDQIEQNQEIEEENNSEESFEDDLNFDDNDQDDVINEKSDEDSDSEDNEM